MKTRQPIGTQHYMFCVHHGHYWEVRFRPDQRILALLCVERWYERRDVSREQYLGLRDQIIDKTWEVY